MSKYAFSDYNSVRAASTNREVERKESSVVFQSLFSVKDPVIDVTLNQSRSPFICGSSSASRKLILENSSYTFDVVKADIDERAIGDRTNGSLEAAESLVLKLAHCKADAILSKMKKMPEWKSCFVPRGSIPDRLPHEVLLTADQIVTCNGAILEKPLSEAEAREFLTMYDSHPCTTVGSLVLTDLVTGLRWSRLDKATIHFKPIAAEVKASYLAEGMCYHCAGALMVENPLLLPFIEMVEGSEESVMGLNSALLCELFDEREADISEQVTSERNEE